MNIPLDVLKEELAYHEARAARLRAIIAEIEGMGPKANGVDDLERLRLRCREAGYVVSGLDEVKESDAAELIGYAPTTLKNWRLDLSGKLPCRKVGSRTVYKLADLANFLREPH